jgi:hypothetical protein
LFRIPAGDILQGFYIRYGVFMNLIDLRTIEAQKRAEIKISARLNPISYEKPVIRL